MTKEHPLVAELLLHGIEARTTKGGVLICDPFALLDLMCGGKVAPALDAQTQNPVGALQEHCQRKAMDLPHYAFESVGTENAPVFRCTVSALGRQGEAELARKT